MDNILFFAFVFVVIYTILFLYHYFTQKRIPLNSVIAFTGSLGSGKTYLAVRTALSRYRRVMWLYKLGLIKEEPAFYSNIPVYIGKGQWSQTLTYEHIISVERIPDHSVLLTDELGNTVSQWEFNNPLARQEVSTFARYFRHAVDGYWIITDQASSNILVDIRRRVSQFYHLSDFRRFLIFFYKVNVEEVHITEDIVNIKDVQDDDTPFFFGSIPFKYFTFFNKIFYPFSKRHYDSRCFSPLYKAEVKTPSIPWAMYKTDYIITLPNTENMRREFKEFGYIPREHIIKYITDWQNKEKIQPPTL